MRTVKLGYGECILVRNGKLFHSAIPFDIASRKVICQVCPYDVVMHPIIDNWIVYNGIELVSSNSKKENAIMLLENKMETMEKDTKGEDANEVVFLYYGNSDKIDIIPYWDKKHWWAFCEFFLFGLE